MPEPTLAALMKLAEANSAEQRQIRAEIRQLFGLVSSLVEAVTRQTAKIDNVAKLVGEARDDLTLTIKAEMGGQFAALETRMEERVGRDIEALVADLTQRVEALERKVQ